MVEHQAGESFVQIVYAKITSNGKTELVPLKLHVDGTLESLQSALTPSAQTVTGEMLLANRYQMQRVLGQGGFGRTYLTLDRHRFNEPCVVKEFLPQHRGDFEAQKSRELFEREAKILHQINHPQIPKFFACFEENERLFLVQEYIQGQTYSNLLRERQQQGRNFTEGEISQWLKDLLPVLGYLHDRHIIHRDISPDNIMLPQDGDKPILIDFGIGRSAVVQGFSQSGNVAAPINYPTQQSIVGKVGYAPHEQIWLGQSFPSSDLYSLAITAIVLLTGIDPQALGTQSALRSQWQFQTCVSDGLVQILNRMVQDIPANRYQSAQAVLAALEQPWAAPQTPGNQESIESSVTTISAPRSAPQPPMPASVTHLTDRFTAQCEQELINYIGPIAKLLVKKTLAKQPNLSPEALVTALAQQIPESTQAIEFRHRLLR